MQIESTPEGIAWVNNFEEVDQPIARLLLKSLSFISINDFSSSLSNLILSVSANLPTPIALVPVREMTETQSYYHPTNNRCAGVKLVSGKSHVGSEGICANIIKNLTLSHNRTYTCTPNLRNLREARVRSFIFVDDFIGSGKRIRDFLDAFNRHKTIKSWRSKKFVEHFAVCTYSSTEQGETTVSRHWYKPKLHKVLRCATLEDAGLTSGQIGAIRTFCEKYSPDEEMSLGFKGTAGLLVLSHKAPNNLPAVLWKYGQKLKPIFPNGAVPPSLLHLFAKSTNATGYRERLLALRQDRLAVGDWLDDDVSLKPDFVLVLAAVSARATTAAAIADKTFLPFFISEALFEAAKKLDLISGGNRLTDAGNRELDRLRAYRKEERPPKHPKKTPEPYFPRSLR